MNGYTTFLRYLQSRIVDRNTRLPIYLHASEIEDWDFRDPETFICLLAEKFRAWIPPDDGVRFLRTVFSRRVLLLVDGLDQIRGVGSDYGRVLRKLARVCREGLIVASRPTAVDAQQENADVKFLRLRSLRPKAQRAYFGSHYKRARALGEQDRDLIAVPMLAYMVRTLIEKGRDQQIKNRATLYRSFIDYILHEYDHEESKLTAEEREEVKVTLQKISYEALARPEPMIQKIELGLCLEHARGHIAIDRLPKYGPVGLIVERLSDGTHQYLEFTHQSFQEYLAATELAKRPNCIEEALKRIYDPAWHQVLVMLGGVLEKPGAYVAALLRANRDDLLCRPFLLAARVCQEIGPEQLPTGVLDELMGEIVRTGLRDAEDFLCEGAKEALHYLPESLGHLTALARGGGEVARTAISLLGEIGSDRAVPALVGMLQEGDPGSRCDAIGSLGKIGSDEAIPALIEMLREEDAAVRSWAAKALGEIGGREAALALMAMLRDEGLSSSHYHAVAAKGSDEVTNLFETMRELDPHIHRVADEALGRIASGQAVPTEVCRGEGPLSCWYQAVDALGEIGCEEAVPVLTEVLRGEGASSYHLRAVWSLGEIGSDKVVPTLVVKTRKGDVGLCRCAAEALGRIGSEDAIPALLETLREGNEERCWSAAEALGKIGSEEVVSALIEMLRDERLSYGHHLSVVTALVEIGSAGVVPALYELLREENAAVRGCAAQALGMVGSREAVPALLKAWQDGDPCVRRGAVEALGMIGATEAVPALYESLREENAVVRAWAAEALGMIGCEEAVPALCGSVREEDATVRAYAAEALGMIGCKEAVPALLETLREEHEERCWTVAKALGKIGSEEAIPALIEMLRDEGLSYDHHRAVMMVLGEIGSDRAQAVPTLIERLRKKDAGPCALPIRALGEIGSEAAIPALTCMLVDTSYAARAAASRALPEVQSNRPLPIPIRASQNRRTPHVDRTRWTAMLHRLKSRNTLLDRLAERCENS